MGGRGSSSGSKIKPHLNKTVSKPSKAEQFKQELRSGKINTTIETGKQNNHIYGKIWKNQVKQAINSNSKSVPKSVLSKGSDPQELVNKYAGTGNLEFPKGSQFPNEYIHLDYVVGRTYDQKQKKYVESHTLQIKYSSDGTHIFPTIDK